MSIKFNAMRSDQFTLSQNSKIVIGILGGSVVCIGVGVATGGIAIAVGMVALVAFKLAAIACASSSILWLAYMIRVISNSKQSEGNSSKKADPIQSQALAAANDATLKTPKNETEEPSVTVIVHTEPVRVDVPLVVPANDETHRHVALTVQKVVDDGEFLSQLQGRVALNVQQLIEGDVNLSYVAAADLEEPVAQNKSEPVQVDEGRIQQFRTILKQLDPSQKSQALENLKRKFVVYEQEITTGQFEEQQIVMCVQDFTNTFKKVNKQDINELKSLLIKRLTVISTITKDISAHIDALLKELQEASSQPAKSQQEQSNDLLKELQEAVTHPANYQPEQEIVIPKEAEKKIAAENPGCNHPIGLKRQEKIDYIVAHYMKHGKIKKATELQDLSLARSILEEIEHQELIVYLKNKLREKSSVKKEKIENYVNQYTAGTLSDGPEKSMLKEIHILQKKEVLEILIQDIEQVLQNAAVEKQLFNFNEKSNDIEIIEYIVSYYLLKNDDIKLTGPDLSIFHKRLFNFVKSKDKQKKLIDKFKTNIGKINENDLKKSLFEKLYEALTPPEESVVKTKNKQAKTVTWAPEVKNVRIPNLEEDNEMSKVELEEDNKMSEMYHTMGIEEIEEAELERLAALFKKFK